MIDDDVLIDDGDVAEVHVDEEDLLDGVATAGDQWAWADSANMPEPVPVTDLPSSEIQPLPALSPRAAPAMPPSFQVPQGSAAAPDDAFCALGSGQDGEPGPLPSSSASSMPATRPGRGLSVLVADPSGLDEGPVDAALQRLGFVPTVCHTAASAREELGTGAYPFAVLRVLGEPGWARLLLASARERSPDVRFLIFVPAAATPSDIGDLRNGGLAQVVSEPLPEDAALFLCIQALRPDLLPLAKQASEVLLTQIRHELERVRLELTGQHQRRDAAERDQRDARQELAVARARMAELETALRARPAAAPALPAELKPLLAALQPYGLAMDQALAFLTRLSGQLGQPGELQRHIKNLHLTRELLKRFEGKTG
jgi:hypothetical protein